VRSLSSRPMSRKLLIQPRTYGICKVRWSTILHENKFVDIFLDGYRGPNVTLKHL
jgi:hypothetical protein